MRGQYIWKQLTLWLGVGAGITLIVAGSPFILQAAAPAGMDWSQLSEISQAYSAVAVLFSAAAFFGAIISILYQAKQTRIMREEIRSSLHSGLILRALDDENLMRCWDPPQTPVTFTDRRQIAFSNLIFRRWLSDYVMRHMNLEASKLTLEVHFKGEVARRHWVEGGPLWLRWAEVCNDRREKEFIILTQRVYEKAVAEGPPVASDSYFLPPNSP
ncbi:DUF6082 family protein [Streptomyces phaeochromogenes]|uniref:DUF6082 family protein n=1 Tax=Streptomyces phaeochromogenes TaxID=1923 RepID=UPI0036C50E49